MPIDPAQRPPQSRYATSEFVRDTHSIDPQAHWQSLLDARLIGTTLLLSDETRTAIAAAERALGIGGSPGIW